MSDTTLTHAAGERGKTGRRPVLTLALTSERPLEPGVRLDLRDVDVVEVGRGERREVAASEVGGERRLRLSWPDGWMSSHHLRLLRVMGSWVLEDLRSKNGTRLDGAPVERAALPDGALVECGHSFLVFRAADVPRDARVEAGPDRVGALATFHVPFGLELARLAAVAHSDVPVLLCGETGTGKEVAARVVHARSARTGAFVAVNCGALPASLVEAELFGSRKGAYTGADAEREGLVRAARAGTLFLDEVGDLPLPAQPALLRVLQEREVVPVGATRAERVDFRLVAATHRDLAALGAEERFRSDLYARLAGFTLTLPPLRARPEDLGLLVAELLGRAGAPSHVRLEHEAARALFRHDWPLNVRELDRALAAALALAAGEPVGLEHLPAGLGAARDATRAEPPIPRPRDRPSGAGGVADAEEAALRDRLVAALELHAGNVSAVARELGKARMQIQRWLRRFDLDPERYRK